MNIPYRWINNITDSGHGKRYCFGMKSSVERSALREKAAFSERLKQAIANYDPKLASPTVLAQEFNRRSRHSTIGRSAAHKWLTGEAIPQQEKLLMLANWLQVSVQWLRYGEAEHQPKPTAKEQRRLDRLQTEFAGLYERDKVLIEKLMREMLSNKP